jgi:hypothetical protein
MEIEVKPRVSVVNLSLFTLFFCCLTCLAYPVYVWFWRAEKDIYVEGGVKSVIFQGTKTYYDRGQEAWFRVNKWNGDDLLEIEYYDHTPQKVRLFYGITREQGQDFYVITPKGVRTSFDMHYKIEQESRPKMETGDPVQ